MNLCFCIPLGQAYTNNRQKIRVLSEQWVTDTLFCPCCGYHSLANLPNNAPVADFCCPRCHAIFELKSTAKKFGNKIADGAYHTMIERITSNNNPSLLLLTYEEYAVTNLELIPSYFFTPDLIEKRKPLPETAVRHGWTGCSILYSHIPRQGKISIIKNRVVQNKQDIVNMYVRSQTLHLTTMDKRSWLFDVLKCVNSIDNEYFSLHDIYAFTDSLAKKHPQNSHIQDKIRQQLQLLRNKGIIAFTGRGQYKKL